MIRNPVIEFAAILSHQKKMVTRLAQIYGYFRKPLNINYYPFYANVELTSFCNLQCSMCLRQKVPRKERNMSFKEFQILDSRIKARHYALHGFGEPLYNKSVFKIIRHINKIGSVSSITSNFLLLDGRAEELVKSGLNILKCSIDAATKETYEEIRSSGEFQTLLSNLNELRDAKRKLGSNLPKLRLNVVIQNANYREVEQIVEIAKEKNAEFLYFQPLVYKQAFQCITPNAEGVALGRERLEHFCRSALSKAKKLKVRTNLKTVLKNIGRYLRENEETPDCFKRICYKPWATVCISVNGTVKPCDILGLSEEVFGNIFDKDYLEIINSQRALAFRQKLLNKQNPSNDCLECFCPSFAEILKSRL